MPRTMMLRALVRIAGSPWPPIHPAWLRSSPVIYRRVCALLAPRLAGASTPIVDPAILTSALSIACGLFFLSSSGCKGKEPLRHDEDVQAVVAADRQLAQKENEILSRRGALQRERRQIQDKRAELQSRKMVLSEGDTQERQKLDVEESKLAQVEASLLNQEFTLNSKLQSLLDEKTGLVDKLAKDKDNKDVLVVRREYGVALREKDLSRREAELAQREKVLAAREQALTERQAKLCPIATTTTIVQTVAPPPSPGGNPATFSRKDVEPLYQAALKAMENKGILTADLPEGTDRFFTEVRHSVSSGDFVRGKYAADQLLATVRKIKIDRAFIGGKINRLSATIRRTPPPAKNRDRVNSLFQQATASYGDGRFAQANSQLNTIYNLLH
jgi:hypothetical protein